MTRNSEERSPSLFVQALNEDAQAVFMGCPGREFILCLSIYQGQPFHTVPSHCDFEPFIFIFLQVVESRFLTICREELLQHGRSDFGDVVLLNSN